ncbi:MAG: MaoC family dehydratase [Anaerolineae bacterium]|jgi:acyl dehydratase
MSLQVGQVASVRRVFTQSDFDRFAALSGDDNPIHVDPEFSARTKFGQTVAHGMFLYSVVCSVLSTRLPGPGTLQVEQELMFPSATPTGEKVEVRVEVTEVQPAEGLAELSTLVIRPDGHAGLQGRTRIQLPDPSTPLRTGFPITNDQIQTPRFPDTRFPDSRLFKGMTSGQRATTRRTFTAADLAEYAKLTHDHNPLYIKPKYAQKMGLEGTVVPGGLLGGLFSYLLGTELPGRGTNYLKQRLHFPCPAYVERELTASVEIIRIRPEKQLVNLSTVCTDPSDNVVCYGEALVLASDVQDDS